MTNVDEFVFEFLKNNSRDTVQVILLTQDVRSRKNLGYISHFGTVLCLTECIL